MSMKQPSADDQAAPAGPVPTMFEAIVRLVTVSATYNRGTVTLAPHAIYTRHDEMYVDAVCLLRDGKPPREEKIGTYKLAGLVDLKLAGTTFRPSKLFTPGDEKYAGTLLMAVEGR